VTTRTAEEGQPTTFVERLKRLPLAGQMVLGLFALLVVVELAGELLSPLGASGGSGRATSSSFATGSHGLAAYAQLLTDNGHRISRITQRLDVATLSGDATLIVADSPVSTKEAAALSAFVDQGGHLVLSGPLAVRVATAVEGAALRFHPTAVGVAQVFAPVPQVAGVTAVESGDGGSFEVTGPQLPILGRDGRVLATWWGRGRGDVVVLADTGALQNAHLAEADDAVFGLALAGPAQRPVLFAEADHAGTSGTGLAAIPTHWKWALVAGGIATLLAMWSAGRRFGPPQDDERELPPPRRAYVDAVAATLAKTKQPEAALAPLRAAARERLRHRVALAPDATEAEFRQAAVNLGLSAGEVAVLFGPIANDDDAELLGRAMARLGGP
jgi:hypothetical protein